jgi:hypothetical protein
VRFKLALETGFADWTLKDYHEFLKAFRKRSVDDVSGIASEVQSKSEEEVQHYLNVFLLRFRELKEKDLVIKKF